MLYRPRFPGRGVMVSTKTPLNTIKNTRLTLSKIIREYIRNDDELEKNVTWYRCLATLMSEMVKAHNVEKNIEIEKRLEKVEAALVEWRAEKKKG